MIFGLGITKLIPIRTASKKKKPPDNGSSRTITSSFPPSMKITYLHSISIQ